MPALFPLRRCRPAAPLIPPSYRVPKPCRAWAGCSCCRLVVVGQAAEDGVAADPLGWQSRDGLVWAVTLDLEHRDVGSGEDRVERGAELPSSVAEEKSDRFRALAVGP